MSRALRVSGHDDEVASNLDGRPIHRWAKSMSVEFVVR